MRQRADAYHIKIQRELSLALRLEVILDTTSEITRLIVVAIHDLLIESQVMSRWRISCQ